MKIIPHTNGRYCISKDGKVFRTSSGKEVAQGRPGSVKISYDETRTTIRISELLDIVRDEPERPDLDKKFGQEKSLIEQYKCLSLRRDEIQHKIDKLARQLAADQSVTI